MLALRLVSEEHPPHRAGPFAIHEAKDSITTYGECFQGSTGLN